MDDIPTDRPSIDWWMAWSSLCSNVVTVCVCRKRRSWVERQRSRTPGQNPPRWPPTLAEMTILGRWARQIKLSFFYGGVCSPWQWMLDPTASCVRAGDLRRRRTSLAGRGQRQTDCAGGWTLWYWAQRQRGGFSSVSSGKRGAGEPS